MNIQLISEAFASLIASNYWIVALIAWSAIWKLIALWHAARNKQVIMFVLLAVLNTLGIAEIIYLLYLRVKHVQQADLKETYKV